MSCDPRRGLSVHDLDFYMDVALGRRDASLAVVNGSVVNVFTREIHENASIIVAGDRIVRVDLDGERSSIGPSTKVLDARGRSVIPGLIDAHTHIFDWLYNVDEAVRHSIKHGVTTIITETEDIYYQCEHRCFIPMLESIGGQPIKIYATIPPIATYDEYSQGLPEDLFDKLIGNAFVLGLGESYWQFVVGKDERILRLYLKMLSAGKSIEGHSAGAKGAKLAAYAAIGTSSCHEPTTSEEFLERLRMGMHVMIREGSVRRDLPGVRGALLSGVALDNVSLVSDSVSPTDLIRWGYMDAVVQEAMDLGVDPIDAIRMATLNPARHFRLDTLTGSLAPGRCADIVLIPSINKVKPDVVVSNGRIVFSSGSIIVEPARPQLDGCRGCLKLPERVTASDFRIVAPGDRVTVRAISYVTNLVTKEIHVEMRALEGSLHADPGEDLLKVSIVTVGGGRRRIFSGFVKGFGISKGALAITNQWDSSGIVVLGADDADMALAVNRVAELGGGISFYRGRREEFVLPLPIAGMIADLPVEELAARLTRLQSILEEAGSGLRDAMLSLETITSPAIPFIRLSAGGLVDVKNGRRLGLFVEAPTSSS